MATKTESLAAALTAAFGTGTESTLTSIGIALGHPGYVAADEVLRDADTAMYQAKAAGSGSSPLLRAARGGLAIRHVPRTRPGIRSPRGFARAENSATFGRQPCFAHE